MPWASGFLLSISPTHSIRMHALHRGASLQCFGPLAIVHYIFPKFPHIVIAIVALVEPLWRCSFGTSVIKAQGFWLDPPHHTHTHTLSIQSPPGPCSCPPMAAFHLRLHGLTVTLATSQNTTALPVLLALFSHLLEGLSRAQPHTHAFPHNVELFVHAHRENKELKLETFI